MSYFIFPTFLVFFITLRWMLDRKCNQWVWMVDWVSLVVFATTILAFSGANMAPKYWPVISGVLCGGSGFLATKVLKNQIMLTRSMIFGVFFAFGGVSDGVISPLILLLPVLLMEADVSMSGAAFLVIINIVWIGLLTVAAFLYQWTIRRIFVN